MTPGSLREAEASNPSGICLARRRLLRSAALSLGLASQTSRAADGVAEADAEKARSDSWDIVIVGAGAAGLTAACRAAEAGAKRVLVLEKEPVCGGSSIISGGLWALASTDLQRADGIDDSPQRFEADLLRIGRHRNDPVIVHAFIEKSISRYNWIRERLHIEPAYLVQGEGFKRAHAFNAPALVMGLRLYAKQLGVRVLASCRALRLMSTPDRRRICGVEAVLGRPEETPLKKSRRCVFRAERGVLLASGGFSRNAKLLEKYWPEMAYRVSSVAAQGSEGDGLLMAQAFGADVADIAYPQSSYPFRLRPSTIRDMTLIPYSGAIIVNNAGRRFADESLPYKDIARIVLKQPGGRSWLVFDERIRRIALKQDLYPEMWRGASWERRSDWLAEGGTWEETAQKTEIPPEALAETVSLYNLALRTGRPDPFGRKALSNTDSSLRVPLETTPCYLMPVTVALLGTYCGLKTDAEGRVIDVEGEVIDGLWAAGEVTGGLHGASFLMGTAFAKAIVFGAAAAESMLQGRLA